jgi:hypothetical protein
MCASLFKHWSSLLLIILILDISTTNYFCILDLLLQSSLSEILWTWHSQARYHTWHHCQRIFSVLLAHSVLSAAQTSGECKFSLLKMCLCSMLSGSLSPRHGASSGCGWRNGLQVWRVAANTLNKQSRTAEKGWSSNLGVGRGANNSPKKLWYYETAYKASDLDWFFGMTPAMEKGYEFWNMECEEHV